VIEIANGKASIEIEKENDEEELKVMVLNQSFKGTYLTVN
jgi:beta-galactosidase